MIHTNTTHSFGLDRSGPTDPLSGIQTLARGYCYPKGEWFFLTLGREKETDVRVTWQEWEKLVEQIKELKALSEKEVTIV